MKYILPPPPRLGTAAGMCCCASRTESGMNGSKAALRPGTRWHGLYELEPAGDELHSYYDRGRSKKGRQLSLEQRERIARAFAARPWVDHTLPIALRLLAGHADPKVDEAAASAIEGLLGQERLAYWTPDALKLVLERYGDRQAEKKLESLKKDCCDYDEDGCAPLADRAAGVGPSRRWCR